MIELYKHQFEDLSAVIAKIKAATTSSSSF